MTIKQSRAMTLIDAIVVVSMCGLVITALAPALKTARSQTQVATCLQNLRTLGQAANGYIVENGTFVFTFHWDYRPASQPTISMNFVTEFIWGGGVPDTRSPDWNSEWGENPLIHNTDVYMIIPANRPFNEYISPGVWWNHPDRWGYQPQRRQIPMELPDYFKCPSDSTCSIPGIGAAPPNADGDLPTDQDPTWRWWGSSYAVNWFWPWYTANSGTFVYTMTGPEHEALLSDKLERGASEFVLFMENRMNVALEGSVPRGAPQDELYQFQGWHGQQNKHAAAFLDGSARYQSFDTNYVDGPGWSAWPNRPWDGSNWEAYQNN